MYKVIDDYCTNIFIGMNEIEKIRILYGKKKKLSQWYSEYKPDVLINGALFNTSDGLPIESFMSDGKTYNTSEWCKEGFGIQKDGNIKFGFIDNTYNDFIVGFPILIKNGKININFDAGASITAKNPRSIISYNNKTNELMLTTIDGRQKNKPGKTITETAKYISQFGVSNSINLDGGGSTQMLVDGKVVNSPSEDRVVSNVIAIWLKKNKNSYSYDNTVENLIKLKIIDISDMQYWEKVLLGIEPMSKEKTRDLIDKLISKIGG